MATDPRLDRPLRWPGGSTGRGRCSECSRRGCSWSRDSPVVTARLSDTEAKSVSVSAAVPAAPANESEVGRESGPGNPAISFVAICTEPGAEGGRAAVRATVFKNGDPDEPVVVEWHTTARVATVVIKAGPRMERFPGGTSGTVAVGEGRPGAGGSPSRPCPAGERLGVKFEWQEGRFVAENE
jgi:hypothetical protein